MPGKGQACFGIADQGTGPGTGGLPVPVHRQGLSGNGRDCKRGQTTADRKAPFSSTGREWKRQGASCNWNWIVQRLDCAAFGLSGWIMQQDHAAGKSGRIRGCRIGADRGPGIQAGSLCAVSLFPERFLNVRLSHRHAAAGPGGVVSCARGEQKTASRGRSPFRLLPLPRAVPALHRLPCRSQRLAPHGRIQERTAGKTGRTKKRRSGTARGWQRPALRLPALRSEGVGTAGRSRYPGGSRRARGICCAR